MCRTGMAMSFPVLGADGFLNYLYSALIENSVTLFVIGRAPQSQPAKQLCVSHELKIDTVASGFARPLRRCLLHMTRKLNCPSRSRNGLRGDRSTDYSQHHRSTSKPTSGQRR